MPIDMDNMLPGFSSQLISGSAAGVAIPGNTAVAGTVQAAAVLRDEEILDVGIVITTATITSPMSIKFGRTSGDDDVVAATSIIAGKAAGTVYRVSDGTLSWAEQSDTEAERRLSKGDYVTFTSDGLGGGAGRYIPFVIMRGAEPLDPIA